MNRIPKPKPKIEKPVKNNTDNKETESSTDSNPQSSEHSSTKKQTPERTDGSDTDKADPDAESHDELRYGKPTLKLPHW